MGEVLRMIVRSNDQGQGQLYFRGLLIPATLPEMLNPGDKIFAKVTQANDQLVLKLLETQKQNDPAPGVKGGGTVQTTLAGQFESIMKNIAGPALFGEKTLPLPEAVTKSGATAENALAKIFGAILSADDLADPKLAQAKLRDIVSGKLPAALRDAADQLKQFLSNSEPAQTGRFLGALREELSLLLLNSARDNESSKKQLDALIDTLSGELKLAKKLPAGDAKQKDLIQATLRELQLAKESPEKTLGQLESSLGRLRDALVPTNNGPLRVDVHTKGELEQIAARLEQLANTQENLNQLNPVMQALGEPALILFPFLAQGLLTHSQVSIETPVDRDGKGGGRGREFEDETDGEADSTPYQRIQVSVPLQNLGTVHVDIAHRKEEILVRFSVADPEPGSFLLEQLEHLAVTLRELNFSRAELVTHIGAKDDALPDWARQNGDAVVA